MSVELFAYVSLFAGISAALVGGVFQSFSDFIMRGLLNAAPAGGIDSMQQLNKTVIRSVFLTTWFLLVPVSIAMAAYAGFTLDGNERRLIIAGAVIYFVGVFLVTVAANVPMNEKLARMPAGSAEAEGYWTHYGRVWTRWNTVRTVASIAAAGCFLFAAMGLVAG